MHELDTSAPGHHDNPFALPGAAGDALGALLVPATVAYAPAVIGAMAGLVVRLRRSRGVERQQLKWVAYVGSLMLSALLLAAVSLAFRSPVVDPIGSVGWGVFLLLVVFGLPAAVGASILRHRLYDIDVVINRTLVYGALTATLGATYLGLVLLIGLTVGPVERRDRGLDARGRRAVPPGARADPGGGRPALLPPPLRRGADAGGVRRAAARRARPRRAARRRPARAWSGRRSSPRTCRCG